MQTFEAKIDGKVVSYPQSATFIVEQRQNKKAYSLLAARDTISEATGKYHKSLQQGMTIRLSAVHNGKVLPLIRRGA